MTEKELSIKMKAEAVDNGLCQKWTEEWSDKETKRDLIRKFVRGIDFCIKNNWPSVEHMKEHFGDVMNEEGVYADQKISLANPDVVVLNGECEAEISCDACISTIWVRHRSKLNIHVTHGGTAYIRMLDNADVSVRCGFFSKAYTYRYSEGVKLYTYGDVREREKIGHYDKKR